MWLVAAALATVLGVWAAWACLRVGDRAAGFLAVQITGLLVSPISWSHHWVWVLPLLLWCLFGDRRRRPAVRLLAVGWFVATGSYVVSLLIAQQYIDQPASGPGGSRRWARSTPAGRHHSERPRRAGRPSRCSDQGKFARLRHPIGRRPLRPHLTGLYASPDRETARRALRALPVIAVGALFGRGSSI